MRVFFHYFDSAEELNKFLTTIAGRTDMSAERVSETSIKLHVWSTH